MKIYIFLFCVCFTQFAIGQCDQEVVTDPSNPSNTHLPDNNDPKFLNRFDWNVQPGFVKTILTNMQFNQEMINIMSPQNGQFLNYIYTGEDPSPENGWELMLLNTGTYPNLDDLPNGDHSDIPYIVLYNRYSGLLRVWANYGEGLLPNGLSFDAVKVILTFDNSDLEFNGLLRLSESYDRALDLPTTSKVSLSVAKHPNSPGDWFVGEIQLAYDPCVCFIPANLRLNFAFVQSQSLELHGRAISVEQDIIENGLVKTKDFLSNFDYTGNTADNGGILIYRTLENMISDYEKKMEEYDSTLIAVNEYNETVKRNLAVMKLFRVVVLNGGSAVATALTGYPWFTTIANLAPNLIGNGDTDADKKKIVKEAEKLLGKEFDKYIAKNFVQKTKPTKPITPVATFTEMHFKGSIVDETEVFGPTFYSPGSYGTAANGSPSVVGNESSYPIYNEPTGSFALLETPKIKVSRQVKDLVQETGRREEDESFGTWRWHGHYNYTSFDYAYETWIKDYQFKLDTDLKYIFNPSLDIKSKEIQVALVIKPRMKENYEYYQIYSNQHMRVSNVFHDPTRLSNLSTIDVNSPNLGMVRHFGDFSILENFRTFPHSFIGYNPNPSPWVNTVRKIMPIDMTSSSFASRKHPKIDSLKFTSAFIPINSFKPVVFSLAQKNQIYITREMISKTKYWASGIPWTVPHPYTPLSYFHQFVNSDLEYAFDVEIKVMVDIVFHTLNSDGENNTVSQVYTYQIPEANLIPSGSEIYPNLQNSIIGGVSNFSDNLTYNNVTFDGNFKNGCVLNGNSYTCHAWDKINITGNIIANPGYSVNFIAGTEIVESPESYIEGEVVRQIGSLVNHPMNEFNVDDMQAYCKGVDGNPSNYQANRGRISLSDSLIIDTFAMIDEIITPLNIKLFPNPATNSATVQLSREAYGATVQVFDLMGRASNVAIRQDGLQFVMDLSNLVHGVYMVKISSAEGTETKSLIVK